MWPPPRVWCGTLLHVALAMRVDTGGSPQIQEVASKDSRGGPHHVCGVALCSVWLLPPTPICVAVPPGVSVISMLSAY